MATVNFTDVCDSLVTLLTVTGIKRAYSYNEIPEAHNEYPAVEVYPDSGDERRHTFIGGVYLSHVVYFCDFYIDKRSNLAQDMANTIPYIDLAIAALEGDADLSDSVKDMWWDWRFAVFDRGGVIFTGLRFTVTVEVF